MGRVTLQDVADHAGVSMKTVSNVVNDYQHISPRMRERVRSAIDELGYRPNRSGRSLATGRSSMIGLAFPDLRRPYFAELAHVFARVAKARGYGMVLIETGGTAEGERAVLDDREAGFVDGLIIHPQSLTAAELDAVRGDASVVFLGEDPQPAGSDQVAVDNVEAAWSRPSALRLEGYRLGLDDAGLAYDGSLLVAREEGDALGAELALTEALERGLDVDALLCREDLAAIGALRALHRRGILVPDDVAVVGWDAIELGASVMPSLTSVAPDTRALAERALDLLLQRVVGDEEPGRHVTVGHRLVLRESAPAAP
jgi:DNA-binding LacI/PurR family transcriptional regulator